MERKLVGDRKRERERLQCPQKQESQRPKANFKGKKGTTKYRRRLIQLHSERKFNVD